MVFSIDDDEDDVNGDDDGFLYWPLNEKKYGDWWLVAGWKEVARDGDDG